MPNDYVDVQRLSEFPEVSQSSERGAAIRFEENNLTSDVSRAVNSSCATGSRRSQPRTRESRHAQNRPKSSRQTTSSQVLHTRDDASRLVVGKIHVRTRTLHGVMQHQQPAVVPIHMSTVNVAC